MNIEQFVIILYGVFWLVLTLYLWFIYLPTKFREDVLNGVLGFLESDDPKDKKKVDAIFTLAADQFVFAIKENELIKTHVKEYLNGTSLAFVNIVCSRFGITQEELKTMIKNAGGTINEDGTIDLMSLVMRKAPVILDRIAEAAIDQFTG